MSRQGWVLRVWLALLLLSCGMACSSAESGVGGGPGSGEPFGAPCQRTEDCASRLCVRRDESVGVCTRACATGAECPASPNWGCVQPNAFPEQVCACVPSADTEVCGDGSDNDCNGLVDDCLTCDGQSVPGDDPAHCGSCDNACRPDQKCVLGQCKCPLEAPFECAGACVDLETDSQHCGACGKTCAAGQSCKSGACSCDDATKPDVCSGVGCVDLSSDVANCGSCGKACPVGQSCNAGACACGSSLLPDYCAGKGCVALSTDAYNCGSCGKVCPSGSQCVGGQCQCPAAKLDVCSNTCVDLWSDEQNCGSCGNVCAAVQSCQSGVCACPVAGTSLCTTACVNLQTDNFNCGSCGNVCPWLQVCTAGNCSCSVSFPDLCNGACTNLKNNNANCGSCGKACPSGQSCQNGVCTCTGYGQTTCGTSCVDTKTDPLNCGGCGLPCPAGQVCSSSACKCPTGQTWCPALSACVSLSSDAQNCGSCGKTCATGEICSGGACVCPTGGQKWCASTGQCTDTYSNNAHCGACDKACPTGTLCSFGNCYCMQAGQTLCGTECVSLSSDPKHCGSCTNVCPGAMTCSSGVCGCPTPTVGTAVRLTTTSPATRHPDAAWNGTHVGLVYTEKDGLQDELYFALLNPDGTRAKSPDIALTNLTGTWDTVKPPADIVWNGSEFAVAWLQTSSTIDVMLQRIAPDGTLKGAAVSVTAKTTGVKLPVDNPPRIGWSPSYGGYVLASPGWSQFGFQRIGADASAPDSANTFSGGGSGPCAIALAPSGEWGVSYMTASSTYLTFFNPDGSKTKAVETLGNPAFTQLRSVDLLHDGSTWLTAWPSSSPYGVAINRGASANSPSVPVTSPTAGPAMELERAGSTLDLTWLVSSLIKLRRFQIPTTSSSTLTALSPEITILGTPNGLEMNVERTGAGSLLVVWSDNRWGAGELYAAPVDLKGCP